MRAPRLAGQKERFIVMRGTALVALLLGSAFLFGVGCGKEEASGTPAPAADPNSTGVAECDDYLKQYKDCFAGTPQAQQTADAANALREKLKGDIQAQGKDPIKAMCISQIEGLKKTCPNKK
jgi:hypothetical protein